MGLLIFFDGGGGIKASSSFRRLMSACVDPSDAILALFARLSTSLSKMKGYVIGNCVRSCGRGSTVQLAILQCSYVLH